MYNVQMITVYPARSSMNKSIAGRNDDEENAG
jgi:hypothetical protein